MAWSVLPSGQRDRKAPRQGTLVVRYAACLRKFRLKAVSRAGMTDSEIKLNGGNGVGLAGG